MLFILDGKVGFTSTSKLQDIWMVMPKNHEVDYSKNKPPHKHHNDRQDDQHQGNK